MSSKKKRRHQAYVERQEKKNQLKAKKEEFRRILRDGTPEDIATAMGVKLK